MLASSGLSLSADTPRTVSPGLLWLMATACAICVASGYYSQPLLSDFATAFHAPAWEAALVATAAQVGYGSGILSSLPLGDLIERRRLVVVLVAACTAALTLTAWAPTLPVLIIGNLLIGLTAISAQILIPLGADLVPAEERGKLVGTLMAGLLCGILGARTFAGLVADHFGWRWVFGIGAALMAILGVALHLNLPRHSANLSMRYGALMRTLLDYWKAQPVLRGASVVSGLSFASFTAFWTVLSFLMAERFHLGASAAGSYGLVGIIGAGLAPSVGKLTDRRGFGFTVAIAVCSSAAAFILMGFWVSLVGLGVGVLLMDLGVQSVQVSAQAKVISLAPEGRSRLNTIYMVCRFVGGALGSFLGAAAWSAGKWPGVVGFCVATNALALAVHYVCVRRYGAR